MANPKYWVVGAFWGDENKAPEFVEKGVWILGWEEGFQPDKAAEMKEGDRIAIKRMRGKGVGGIKIDHLGVIKSVLPETSKVVCVVNWAATNLERDIEESRGCFKSVHGPFEHDEWVEKVFCL